MDTHKKELLDYVIKVTTDTLNIIRDNSDPLLSQLSRFISGNLGISVDLDQSKWQVLADINELFEERQELLKNMNLDKLEEKMHGLDRNYYDNINIITEFIKENYNIDIDSRVLSPRKDTHEVLDEIIKVL